MAHKIFQAARRLSIAYPVIQGPFGGGLSSAALVAAVSNRGGLGSFGVHHLEAPEIAKVACDIRALTDKPFALNLWISGHDEGGETLTQDAFDRIFDIYAPYFEILGIEKPMRPAHFGNYFRDQIEAVLEARPAAFSFVFGIPPADILARCRRAGIATIGAATTLAEARALEEASVDLIVATGFEAGGHRPSFLASAEDSLMGTFALTQIVADRVRVPVIAAGGIVDGRGIQAALTLGASAAQLGTAFLACSESGASENHRTALFGAHAEHTVLTRAYSGRLARGLRNQWAEEIGQRALAPYPIPNFFLGKLRHAAIAAGRTGLMSLWGGQSAPNLRHRSASDLMEALLKDFD